MNAAADRPAARDLRPLFAPRSIAVVGASPTSRVGTNLVRNLQQLGYAGRIYPINPNYTEVFGLRCFPSLTAVPEPIDAAVLGVATARVLPVLEEAARQGVRAAVISSGGFAEAGEEGRARQAAIQRLAERHGLLVCGPNCTGIISFANQQAMYIGGIPSDAARGRVGAVCQSGSVGIALLQSGRLAFSHLVSSGNEAVVDAAEYLAYLVEDPETDVLVAFLEGLRAPQRFLDVADRARALGKPLIVLKVGNSMQAAAATLAHTGALAGSAAVTRAAFRQHGVIQVDDLDTLIETAALFATLGRRLPRGPGVGLVTVSGGHVGLLLDVAERACLVFPELAPSTCDALAEVLGSPLALSNPFDAWGTGDMEQAYPRCLQLLAADEYVDLVAVCQDAPATDDPLLLNPLRAARATASLAPTIDKPVVFFTTFSGAIHPEVTAVLAGAGVPLLRGASASVEAISRLVEYGQRGRDSVPRASPARDANRERVVALLAARRPALSEYSSLQVLAAYGISVPRHARVGSAEEAVAAAERIGYPVAVKVCSPDLPHKTEAGAVRLGLADAAAVRSAYAEVLANARAAAPAATVEGVLVQEMLRGLELIAGLSRDPTFGPTVVLGIGGIFAEVLHDVSLRLAPLSAADAEAMIDELRGRALLDGYRGQPAVDRSAIVATLLGLSRLALDWQDTIAAVDVNPLLVSDAGAFAADALVVCGRENRDGLEQRAGAGLSPTASH